MKLSPALRAAFALALALVFFVLPVRAQESRMDVVLKRDKLIVATYSTAPPLAFTDDKGQLVGFEIDLARLIAKDLLGDPNKIEFMIVQSEGRFPSVLSGRADFAIAATTIYPERAAKVAFTTPYMDSGVAMLVRRDANVHNLADLNNEKFTITGQNNPQNAERAKRFVPKAKTIWFDNPSELLLAVKSGRATAMQTDVPIADYFRAAEQGSRGAAGPGRKARRRQQRDLHEARRLHLVAVPRHRRQRDALRLALSGVLRPVPQVVRQGPAAAKVLHRQAQVARAAPVRAPSVSHCRCLDLSFVGRFLPGLLEGTLITLELSVLAITAALVLGHGDRARRAVGSQDPRRCRRAPSSSACATRRCWCSSTWSISAWE